MSFDFNRGFDGDPIEEGRECPIIAISANVIERETSALHRAYSDAIVAAGGVPLIVPQGCGVSALRRIVKCVDGVLFSGGDDFDACYFGEENIEGLTQYNSERDYHEFALLRAAIDCRLPIFGICRGFQLVNIALGGNIYQDLPSQYPTPLLKHSILNVDRHLGVHGVMIDEGSQLHQILQCSNISVNSRHHQGLKEIAPSLKGVARSSDGVVEALEGYPIHKIIGVQWHPENMATQGKCEAMARLFRFFVEEAQLYREARKIHKESLIVDSHCDTPMLYEEGGFDLSRRNSSAKVDIAKMEEGELDATITVAYIPQSTPIDIATQKAIDILNHFASDVALYRERIEIIDDIKKLAEVKRSGRRAVMLGLENGLALGDDLSNLERFKELGVVYITLCHNGSNSICDSAKGEALHGGVSEFGRRVVERMNEIGIAIDVSHSSEETTMQAVELSRQPIIASHSSCRALCDHPRNLSDEAIRAIAAKGGVVQVCCYSGFLCLDREASILDLISHIEHVVSLVGYNHVGVGSDFDGGGGVEGFDGANDFISLTVELLRRGHLRDDIAKIMGGNILRVITSIQNV